MAGEQTPRCEAPLCPPTTATNPRQRGRERSQSDHPAAAASKEPPCAEGAPRERLAALTPPGRPRDVRGARPWLEPAA